MSGRIRLSASELEQLSQQTGAQQLNLEQVVQQVNAAVNGRDWQSSAAESFHARWRQDMAVLERLEADLAKVSRELAGHAQVAHAVNRPFR